MKKLLTMALALVLVLSCVFAALFLIWEITWFNFLPCIPYEGFAATGRAKYVFVNGILAAENGEPSRVCAGRYVAR